MRTTTTIGLAMTTAVLGGALFLGGPGLAQTQAEPIGPRGGAEPMPGELGQQQEQQKQQKQQGQRARAGQGQVTMEVTAGALAADPQRYMGQLVAVRAEVEDVESPHVFTLDEERIGAGPDVLVLNPTPLRDVPEDEEVTVIGVVRPFVETDIRRDYSWFRPSNEIVATFTGRPVIVAERVVRHVDDDDLIDSRGGGPLEPIEPVEPRDRLEPIPPSTNQNDDMRIPDTGAENAPRTP